MIDQPKPKRARKRQSKHVAEIIDLGPHHRMTADQALSVAARSGFDKVLIVGMDQNGDLEVLTSVITPQDVLWMAEVVKQTIFD